MDKEIITKQIRNIIEEGNINDLLEVIEEEFDRKAKFYGKAGQDRTQYLFNRPLEERQAIGDGIMIESIKFFNRSQYFHDLKRAMFDLRKVKEQEENST